MSNGLYFFVNAAGKVVYIGVARSRALIERIPAHLDTRPGSWFGTLVDRLAKFATPPSAPADVLEEALDLRVALLIADLADVDLGATETALRHAFSPRLNTPRRLRVVDEQATLGSLA